MLPHCLGNVLHPKTNCVLQVHLLCMVEKHRKICVQNLRLCRLQKIELLCQRGNVFYPAHCPLRIILEWVDHIPEHSVNLLLLHLHPKLQVNVGICRPNPLSIWDSILQTVFTIRHVQLHGFASSELNGSAPLLKPSRHPTPNTTKRQRVLKLMPWWWTLGHFKTSN